MEQNKRFRMIRSAVMIVCMSFVPIAFAGASAQMLANNCVSCHGPDGNSLGPATPSIAGVDKDNFVDIMESYKNEGGRFSTIMGRIAKGFDDREIGLLAGYFSKKKRTHPKQEVDQSMVANGTNIHKKTCRKCHDDFDEGDIILRGQWKDYLLNTIHDFSKLDINTIKFKDVKKMVKNLKKLSDEDRQAIASYYASKKYSTGK